MKHCTLRIACCSRLMAMAPGGRLEAFFMRKNPLSLSMAEGSWRSQQGWVS